MKRRIVSVLLALVMVLSIVPTVALAENEPEQTEPLEQIEQLEQDEQDAQVVQGEQSAEGAQLLQDEQPELTLKTEQAISADKVRVIVENTTYPTANGAPWYGTLVDKWIDLASNSTMMSCVVDALESYSQTGAESNYITEINGLAAFDGGGMSGWMGTLNDWFTNEDFGAFTVAKGTLADGDEIRIMYSRDYGADCGSSWSNTDKSVKAVVFQTKNQDDTFTNVGALDRTFSKTDTAEYTLYLAEGQTSLYVLPTAANKNYQVRTSVNGTEYKRTAAIPVQEGTVITVKCGDPGWPSMNGETGEAKTYTFKVSYATPEAKPQIVLPTTNCYTSDDGKIYLLGAKNDTVQLSITGVADPGKVTWKSGSTTSAAIDNNGLLTFKKDFTSASSVKFTASLDGKAIADITLYLSEAFRKTGSPASAISLPASNLEPVKATAKVTASLAQAKGFVTWRIDEGADCIEVPADLSGKSSVDITAKRPGSVKITAAFNQNHALDQVFAFTITGVAVEAADGASNRMAISAAVPTPTLQLQAYLESGATLVSWASDDTSVATVDSTGKVTALKTGAATITATDSNGKTGSYRVEIIEEGKPYFDVLNFNTPAASNWASGQSYIPAKTDYSVTLNAYGTSTLTVSASTAYDTAKYIATASYTDSNGTAQSISVNSGKITSLENIPFDESLLTISLAEKANPGNKTDYHFTVTRPRDTTKALKATTGIVFTPVGRALSAYQYQGKSEGTLFQADDQGVATTTAGFFSTEYCYRTYVLEELKQFTLSLTGSTNFSHIRYSADEGKTWSADSQKVMETAKLDLSNAKNTKVIIQVLDDKTYSDNVKAGKDGFAEATPTTYTVWIEKANVDFSAVQVKTATVENGEFYPTFDPGKLTYTVVVPNGTKTMDMTFTVSDGATVKVGTKEATATEGKYTITLTTSAQKINVTSADGSLTNTYSFKLQARSALAYQDSVVDYLCINSQYTNGNFSDPTATLGGGICSLGNWGGYITYYFKEPLTDDPHNKYGMDFYAYGNSNITTGTTSSQGFAESGQVWVSEDGETWYALAGSEHYEDDVLWNYQVTYSKTAAGKTAWVDNQGNSNDGTAKSGKWVDPNFYYLNNLAKEDTFSLTGICLPSSQGTICGDGSANAHETSFGYVDYFPNGTVGADVNPYIQTPVNANGFDLAWAVDAQGNAVDVSGKEFHYVKIVTASNIWHTSFGEKSTESAGVLRTTAQNTAVGKTNMPVIKVNGTEVTDFSKAVAVNEAFSVTVDAPDGANVYINNQWGSSREFTAIPEHGMIRVIAQEGDKEAAIVTFAVSYDPSVVMDSVKQKYTDVGDSLLADAVKTTPTVGSIGGEWLMLGLARSGKLTDAIHTTAYYQSVVDYVTAAASKARDTNPSTDYSRMILALTAIGKDPTNVGGVNLTAKLGSMSYLNKQGTNGPVWALLALDSHNYAVSGDVTRDGLVKAIADIQMASGGWYISDTNPVEDVDMTAMAVQALAPYYAKNSDAKSAVDKALTWLASKQGRDGDFGTSESDAQVVVALCALGRDPASDALFIKGWNSVLSAMCSYYADGASKGFKHTKDGDYNQMATEQCYYALTAYERMKAGKTFLYDMSDMCLGQHSFANWIETKAASCTETGSRSRTCTKCGVVETEEIAVLGHQMTKTPAKAPTCTADGNNEYYTCSRCKIVFKDATGRTATTVSDETLAATGHNWADANCTAPKTCRKCGLTEGTTLAHTYNGGGVCTVCGSKNPVAGVKVEAIKAGGDNTFSDNSGLVIESNGATLEQIQDALTNGSTALASEIPATVIPEGSVGTSELKALADSLSGEQKQEVNELIETFADMQKDSDKENVKVEMVLNLSMELKDSDGEPIAELIELPSAVTVRVPISNEEYAALKGKSICILRSHTDASGETVVTELKATIGGTEDSYYYVEFASDRFSTFALVSYEPVQHDDPVKPWKPGKKDRETNTTVKSGNTGDMGVVLYIVMGAMGCIGSTALLRKHKEDL